MLGEWFVFNSVIQFVLGIGMHLGLGLCHKRCCLVGGLHFVSLTYKHGNILGNVVA